jgi:hypothetical protein
MILSASSGDIGHAGRREFEHGQRGERKRRHYSHPAMSAADTPAAPAPSTAPS